MTRGLRPRTSRSSRERPSWLSPSRVCSAVSSAAPLTSTTAWLAIEEVSDGVVLAIFYLLGAILVAGAALLADVALARIDG